MERGDGGGESDRNFAVQVFKRISLKCHSKPSVERRKNSGVKWKKRMKYEANIADIFRDLDQRVPPMCHSLKGGRLPLIRNWSTI